MRGPSKSQFSKVPKIVQFWGSFWACFLLSLATHRHPWSRFGDSLGFCDSFRTHLVPCGAPVRSLWASCGLSWTPFGCLWALLGSFWVSFGLFLVPPWSKTGSFYVSPLLQCTGPVGQFGFALERHVARLELILAGLMLQPGPQPCWPGFQSC